MKFDDVIKVFKMWFAYWLVLQTSLKLEAKFNKVWNLNKVYNLHHILSPPGHALTSSFWYLSSTCWLMMVNQRTIPLPVYKSRFIIHNAWLDIDNPEQRRLWTFMIKIQVRIQISRCPPVTGLFHQLSSPHDGRTLETRVNQINFAKLCLIGS